MEKSCGTCSLGTVLFGGIPFCNHLDAITKDGFYCCCWEQCAVEQDGPFRISSFQGRDDIWYICYGDQVSPAALSVELMAERFKDWLNELWKEKAQHSCRNCEFMCTLEIRCHKEHGENYTISCNEWEPQ